MKTGDCPTLVDDVRRIQTYGFHAMGPSTIEKISIRTSSKGCPDLAICVGFVVTPSRRPQLAAVRISFTLAVSMKSCTIGADYNILGMVSIREALLTGTTRGGSRPWSFAAILAAGSLAGPHAALPGDGD